MPNPTRAASPTRTIFDAWNSSATGHQRADNRLAGSTAWRASRTVKLAAQLADASQAGQAGGQQRQADLVGAGSEDFGRDGRLPSGKWARGASGLRREQGGRGQAGLGEFWRVGKGAGEAVVDGGCGGRGLKRRRLGGGDDGGVVDTVAVGKDGQLKAEGRRRSDDAVRPKQIFAQLTFYINGSTYPTVSDHKLKRLLAQHGGHLALGLERRKVTHVILGRPSSAGEGKGSGVGLAARKVQKEVSSALSGHGSVNSGIRYVSADWVLECIRLGRRVNEWSSNEGTSGSMGAAAGQTSVLGMFERTKAKQKPEDDGR